ncbi:hypothetical protein [Niallia sp. NCCP-28]|nr:hypothetical protein [Niallia sp. NCCP-28]GKU83935.1 hypothetical protein NCCP28_33310 [Niallia sp. NCCP-28]
MGDFESDKASVYAKLTYYSGEPDEVQLAMIKEDGKWNVFAFGSY